MAFDSTLGTPLSTAKALQVDQTSPSKLLNKITRRARQVQTQANIATASQTITVFATGDTITGNSEVAFATHTEVFQPGDDATKEAVIAGTRFRVRAQVEVTGAHSNDTLQLRFRLGDHATIGSNLELYDSTAKDATANDTVNIEADIVFKAVGGSGSVLGGGQSYGDGNFARRDVAVPVTSFDTTALGTTPKLQVSGVFSSANAANIASLTMIQIECFSPNEALTA